MIDLKIFDHKNEANKEAYQEYRRCLEMRGGDLALLDQLLLDANHRRELIAKAEAEKAHLNKLSAQIPQMKRSGQDATAVLQDLAEKSAVVKRLEAEAQEKDELVKNKAAQLPNVLHPDVPNGLGEQDNRLVKSWGTPRNFDFTPKEHWELGESLGVLDFERAGKVTGSRYTFLTGAGTRLERALIQFFMDVHADQHGYTEMIPPFVVNSDSYFATGQFPKFVDDVFHLQGTETHLISTAEVPVTNYYRNEVVDERLLPLRYCAFSPCFRSEAGSHGRDTKGLIRQHQFHKVELLIFCQPEKSVELHEQLTTHAERVLEMLELPYRRMLLCSRDIGFSAAKCYDLEVWLPGAQSFREISSCSNFLDFQARRGQIRYRSGKEKPQFVHTINGSGLAVGRTLIAILENYQNQDGSITIPKVLRPYMGGREAIKKTTTPST